MSEAPVYVATWCVMELCNPKLETLGIFHNVESAFRAVIQKGVDEDLIVKDRFIDSFYNSPHLQKRMSQKMPCLSPQEFASFLYNFYFKAEDLMSIEKMKESMSNLLDWCSLKYMQEHCIYNVSAHIL